MEFGNRCGRATGRRRAGVHPELEVILAANGTVQRPKSARSQSWYVRRPDSARRYLYVANC